MKKSYLAVLFGYLLFCAPILNAGSISVNFTPSANVSDVEAGISYGLVPVDGVY